MTGFGRLFHQNTHLCACFVSLCDFTVLRISVHLLAQHLLTQHCQNCNSVIYSARPAVGCPPYPAFGTDRDVFCTFGHLMGLVRTFGHLMGPIRWNQMLNPCRLRLQKRIFGQLMGPVGGQFMGKATLIFLSRVPERGWYSSPSTLVTNPTVTP